MYKHQILFMCCSLDANLVTYHMKTFWWQSLLGAKPIANPFNFLVCVTQHPAMTILRWFWIVWKKILQGYNLVMVMIKLLINLFEEVGHQTVNRVMAKWLQFSVGAILWNSKRKSHSWVSPQWRDMFIPDIEWNRVHVLVQRMHKNFYYVGRGILTSILWGCWPDFSFWVYMIYQYAAVTHSLLSHA